MVNGRTPRKVSRSDDRGTPEIESSIGKRIQGILGGKVDL